MAIPECGQLVLTLFDQLIQRVKSSQPVRTDGKSLTTGFVYSQLPLGMMIRNEDYGNPWSPIGGSSLATPAPATTASATGSGTTPGSSSTGPDPRQLRAQQAAALTSHLVNDMLKVSKDNSYMTYEGGGKKLGLAYDGIITGMQALPAPPVSPDVQKQLDAANSVLYVTDDYGVQQKSPIYKQYQKNALAYASALTALTFAKNQILGNPATADSWPMMQASYQMAVDNAYDDWTTEGATKVENALDVIQSAGKSIQDAMIAAAKKIFEHYTFDINVCGDGTPYSYLLPSDWCDCNSDSDGWTKLTINTSEYKNHTQASSNTVNAGVVGSFGFVNFGGSASSSNASSSFKNDSSDLNIELEYGMVTVNRDWLVGDLFYMQNWYLVNNKKNAISNGTLDEQDTNLLPMIPEQFLAIRNVKITSGNWGNDGKTLSSSFSGGGGVSLGFINFGASDSSTNSSSDNSGHFDGATLSINGVQIVAWLSTIVPPNAPLDDPGLNSTTNSATTTAASAGTNTATVAITTPPATNTAAPGN